MPSSYTTSHTKKLTNIREKMASLCEDKIRHNLSQELSKCLIDADALEVDFNTLIGGLLEVIATAKIDADKASPEQRRRVEAWRKSGAMFRQRRRKGEEKEGQGKACRPFSPTMQQQKEIA